MAVVRRILKLVTTTIIRKSNLSKTWNTLSKETPESKLGRLKQDDHIPVIKWCIVCKVKPYHSGAMHGQLCLAKKTGDLAADSETTLY